MRLSHTKLYLQYYKDRFPLGFPHLGEPCEQSLKCINLPHVDLVKKFTEDGWKKELKNHPYYIMHQNWGRKHDWIVAKVKNFYRLYRDMENQGHKISVKVKKRSSNDFFYDGFEIIDGHHRVSICINLGIKKIKCQEIK